MVGLFFIYLCSLLAFFNTHFYFFTTCIFQMTLKFITAILQQTVQDDNSKGKKFIMSPSTPNS